MNTNTNENMAFSRRDDIVFHPKTFFSNELLEKIKPYQIFTGIGVVAVLFDKKLQIQYRYYKNEKELTKRLKINSKYKLLKIEECFFAYVVQQQRLDSFQLNGGR